MNKLEKALNRLLSHGELTNRLAQVLARASERGRVSYREVEKMVNGDAEIRDSIKLRQTRPFVTKEQAYLIPTKSVFNRIIGDSHFELLFARFLEDCGDVVSYAKNYMAVHFKLDYVNADGNISNYYPDFFVKLSDKHIYIVETKG